MIRTDMANIKLFILLVLVCLGCAEIQLRTKETPNGIDATCQPGRHVVNIYRRWSICLSDGECIYIWHPVTGVNLTMSEELEIMLILHPVKSSDKAFIATLMHGNGSASNNTAGNITLSCGVKLSDGLNWSPSVQISLQFTSVPPTENTTVLSNPGTTHNSSNTTESDGITAIPTKYVLFMCIAMTVVLMWGLN